MTDETTLSNEESLESLAERLGGELVTPADPEYDSARRVWNGTIDRHPAAIARVAGTADIIEAIDFARDAGVRVTVRGGGHDVTGTAIQDDCLVIDCSRMRGVLVDPESKTARVQAGATWGDVDRETQTFGLVVPGGVVSTTGVASQTLAGGYGWTRRKYGLTCDNLRSADVVTADGEFVTASEDRHEDLFWAIRGGGGNFGVVTAFEFDCQEFGPDAYLLAAMYPMEIAPDVLAEWRDFTLAAQEEVTVDAVLWTVPDHPLFPDELQGTPTIALLGTYAGSVEDGATTLRTLREIDETLLDASGPTTYRQMQSLMDPFFPSHSYRYYWKSHYLTTLDFDAIETVVDFATRRPSPRTPIPIRSLGGAIASVGTDETAFPERTSPFLLSIDGTWTDPDDDDRNVAWVDEFYETMHPYSTGITYRNFPMDEELDDESRERFGDNYERLSRVKRKYDPEGVFGTRLVPPTDDD